MKENRREAFMEILGKARGRGASDVHVAPGYPVMFRTDGIMEQAAGERLTSADTEALVRAVLAEARGQAACSAECVPGEACAPGSEGAQTQKESGPVCAENDVKTCAHTADGADDALIPAERELVFTAGDAGRVRAGIFRQRGDDNACGDDSCDRRALCAPGDHAGSSSGVSA